MSIQNSLRCRLKVSIENGLDIFDCKLEFEEWLPDSLQADSVDDWCGYVDSINEEEMCLVLECGYVSSNISVVDIQSQIRSEFTFVRDVVQVVREG